MTEVMSTRQVAEGIGTDPRTLRKFLRSSLSPFEAVGQGARYNFNTSDIAELKECFAKWSTVKKVQPTSTSPSSTRSSRVSRSKKAPDKIDPLAADTLLTRLNSSIYQRQVDHKLICAYTMAHPKVDGLTVRCKQIPQEGEDYCQRHAQEDYCGEIEDTLCGPEYGKPYCKYHNGDISEEDFADLTAS